MNRKAAIIIVLAVCILFIAGVSVMSLMSASGSWDLGWDWFNFGGERIDVDESAGVSVSGVSEVQVILPSGNVVVEAGEPGASLKGYFTARERKDQYLFVENEGGKLKIEFDPGKRSWLSDTHITLTVRLPKELAADIDVTNSSGGVNVEGISAKEMEIRNSSGSVDITGCAGTTLKASLSSGNMSARSLSFDAIDIDCQSGNIRIQDTAGALSVQHTSGNIDIIDAAGTIEARNSSGNIDISLSEKRISGIKAGVSSGNITLHLDAQAAFKLDARTSSGGVYCDFDILVSGGSDRGSLEGDCNGGGEPVKLSTSSGNVSVLIRK